MPRKNRPLIIIIEQDEPSVMMQLAALSHKLKHLCPISMLMGTIFTKLQVHNFVHLMFLMSFFGYAMSQSEVQFISYRKKLLVLQMLLGSLYVTHIINTGFLMHLWGDERLGSVFAQPCACLAAYVLHISENSVREDIKEQEEKLEQWRRSLFS